LERGVDVVVATPGRALDHLSRGSLDLSGVQMVVLDEADEMLDMGFAEEIEAVLAETPKERQTVLFSATMPPRIEAIAKRNQRDPMRIRIAREVVAAGELPKVRQQAYVVQRNAKMLALARVLDLESPTAAIVFCRTRTEVDELTETMTARGFQSEGLHGGMTQEQRDRVMKRLRAKTTEILIATDVAARGLDVEHLTHVINYDLPNAPEAYVHRIGRVGRAGREGVAITLVEPREHHLLRNIERITKQKIEVAQVPTIADLRNRRLELTRAALREAILAEETSEHFRVVVDALSDEFDVVQIAMAAVKLYHQASGGDGDENEGEIVAAPRAAQAHERSRARPDRKRDDAPYALGAGGEMTKLFIAAGREAGIRPQDLVGAIANEAGVSGKAIGAIEISERFSLVEVPEDAANQVIKALRDTKIRGKKVSVRRDKQ
ncbi:MAG TPA: helicase-related protein, partial [Usitatibacter sp.]